MLLQSPLLSSKCTRCVVPFRSQPVWSRPNTIRAATGPEGGEEISDAMRADLERYKQRSQAPVQPSRSFEAQEEKQSSSSFKEIIDKILIADVFVVLFSLLWLGVGVVLATASGTGSSPVLDAWYPLWPTLWQSAIGLLMAGALVSGGLGWVAEQQKKK